MTDAETERRKQCYAKAHATIVQAADDAGYEFHVDDEKEQAFLGRLEQELAAALIGNDN